MTRVVSLHPPAQSVWLSAQELHFAGTESGLPSGHAYSSAHGLDLADRVPGTYGWRPCAHASGRFKCQFNGAQWLEVFEESDNGV